MSSYSRPPFPELTFRDAEGHVIAYGDRWPDGDGPDDTYEVVSHPERFEPLHTIADALVEHLVAEYDVAIADTPDPARPEFRRNDGSGFERCVRLVPSDPSAAALTFLYYPFPAVTVHAGLLHWEPFPGCACDHCDETADGAADELEQLVFAVVDGGLGEQLSSAREERIELRSADGEMNQSSFGPEPNLTTDEVASVRTKLERIDGWWAAWPRRNSSA